MRHLDLALSELRAVVLDHLSDTLSDTVLRLPLEDLLGSRGVGSSSLGVVDRHVLVDDADSLGERVALLLLDLLDNVLRVSLLFKYQAKRDVLGQPRRTP